MYNKKLLWLIPAIPILLAAYVYLRSGSNAYDPSVERYKEQAYILSNEKTALKERLKSSLKQYLATSQELYKNEQIVRKIEDNFVKTSKPATVEQLKEFTTFTLSLKDQLTVEKPEIDAILAIIVEEPSIVPQAKADGIPLTSVEGIADYKARIQKFASSYNSKYDVELVNKIYDYSVEKNIDPFVPFCMAFADSQFASQGKGARTNNPCNYAHTDDGRTTYEFADLEAGTKKCVDGLNSKLRIKATVVGELSLGGRKVTAGAQWNKGGKELIPIQKMWWASSEYNWNNNVVNCLRNLVGDPNINEFYKIRYE